MENMDCSTAVPISVPTSQPDVAIEQEHSQTFAVNQMSILHKYVLRNNRVAIKEELELSVLDHLVSSGSLNPTHSEDIQAERTRRDKAVRLLDVLERRGSLAFSALVNSLKTTQSHLASMLEKWVEEASKIDEEVMRRFLSDDGSTKTDKAVLPLNIVTIHMEQKVGSSKYSVDLPLSLDVIMGDEDRYERLCKRLKKLQASLCSCKEGSILLMLSFRTSTDLTKFWLAYLDGTLQRQLAPVVVTDKLKQEYPGAEFTLNLNIDIDQYIEAIRQLHGRRQYEESFVGEPVQTRWKYAEIDMSIKLKYLHGDADEDLNRAQQILDGKLLWSREPRCIDALTEFLEGRGLLLVEGSNGCCLQARSLNLGWLSKVDSDFSWSLDGTEFASILLDTSVIQAAKGNPLNISWYAESVSVAHFTNEEEPMLNQLRELTERMTERPAEGGLQVARFLEDLTTRAPTDITSESGFIDDQSLAGTDFDVQPRTDRPIYDITSSKNKGVLVIINNMTFAPDTRLSHRMGSDVDVSRLNRVFTELGFQIQVLQDLRVAEMAEVIRRAAMKAAEDNVSCFACAISTHGDDGVLYGVDGLIQTKTLIEIVASVRGLAGKPKLFFLQADRGTKLDEGVPFDDGRDARETPPLTADLLICNSTVADYYSWRNQRMGSWFVHAIENVFAEYGKTEDILSMMTRVGHAVSMQYISNSRNSDMNNKKQMPVFESSLTKTLYLKDPLS